MCVYKATETQRKHAGAVEMVDFPCVSLYNMTLKVLFLNLYSAQYIMFSYFVKEDI